MISAPDIAKRIKEVAKKKNVGIQAMLDACGLSKNALSSMTAGSYPKADTLLKMADYLEVSADYLFNRGMMYAAKYKKTEVIAMTRENAQQKVSAFLNCVWGELTSEYGSDSEIIRVLKSSGVKLSSSTIASYKSGRQLASLDDFEKFECIIKNEDEIKQLYDDALTALAAYECNPSPLNEDGSGAAVS